MNKKFFSIAVPLLWTAIVFVLHVMPVQARESSFFIPHMDKVVHFGMFATLSFLFLRSLRFNLSSVKPLHLLLVAIVCLGYGALMEYLQTAARRDSDILDWCADGLGTIAGIWTATTEFLPFFFGHKVRKSS